MHCLLCAKVGSWWWLQSCLISPFESRAFFDSVVLHFFFVIIIKFVVFPHLPCLCPHYVSWTCVTLNLRFSWRVSQFPTSPRTVIVTMSRKFCTFLEVPQCLETMSYTDYDPVSVCAWCREVWSRETSKFATYVNWWHVKLQEKFFLSLFR